MAIDVKKLFASSGGRIDITDEEWAGGWEQITAGTDGIPTSQQFNTVFHLLCSFISNAATKLDETAKKGDTAVQETDFTPAKLLAKLLEADGHTSGLDADLLDGKHGSDYALVGKAFSVYTETKSGTTHALKGSGSYGCFMLNGTFNAGDKFTVNGTAVTAYAGGDTLDSLVVGHWYGFFHDSSKNTIDFFATGMNRYLQKAGGTMTGTTFYGNNSNYITAAGAAALTSLTVSGDIRGTKVYGAVYNNDYAEFFPRGEETEAGDIIALAPDGMADRYIRATAGMRVVGVHSAEYGCVIGGEEAPESVDFIRWNEERYIPVGMAGRCSCKVYGDVRRGQLIVPGEIPGVGVAVDKADNIMDVVGFAVEDAFGDCVHTVRIKIGR